MANKCSKCQSAKTASTGVNSATLEPKGGGMLGAAIKVGLQATVCLDCGHVDLSADPGDLKGLAALS